jgi:lactose/L-arabinose transport system substrate-binding protein
MIRVSTGVRRALGIAVAAASVLVASTALAATTITVWCWDKNFNGAAMQAAADVYTKLHPDVTFNIVVSAKQDDLVPKLQTQLLSGNLTGLPEIVLIQDDRAQKFLQSFPGDFEPLNDKIDLSKFAQYKVASATLDGKSYSLPFDSGVTGLFYRTDYLAAAGHKPEELNDISWDQLIAIGKDVTAKTGHPFLDLDLNDDGLVRVMMQSAGKWFFKADGSLDVVDNAPLKTALTEYAKIWQAGIVKPVSGWGDYTGSFTSGETAAVISGVWMTGTVKSVADQAGKWGVAPIPKLEGVDGATHASNMGGSSWFVFSSAPNKAAAIDFLKTVWGGDVDFYQKILVGQGAVGSLLDARSGAAYKASDAFFGGQPVWLSFSTWLGQIPGVSYGIYTSEVDSAVQAQLPAISKGGSVDDALKAINDQAQAQMQ